MSGKKSLRKGKVGEYKARKYLESLGHVVVVQAEDANAPDFRIVKGMYGGYNLDENWEVKYRSSIPKCLYDWLEEKSADALVIRRVNKKDGRSWPWLIVRKLE